ncbi:unnamed protein product [Lepidochelys olivacea]
MGRCGGTFEDPAEGVLQQPGGSAQCLSPLSPAGCNGAHTVCQDGHSRVPSGAVGEALRTARGTGCKGDMVSIKSTLQPNMVPAITQHAVTPLWPRHGQGGVGYMPHCKQTRVT